MAFPDLSYARDIWMRGLRRFDLNSSEVALQELGTHLKSNASDLYALSWRRFEELIEDVFKCFGLRTVLTQPSKDGGADILILQNDSQKIQAIVECKKYSENRTVGIQTVRSLVGAAVAWDVREMCLITTGSFSREAESITARYEDLGFRVDLLAAADLLKILNVYNAELPPLDKLTPKIREDIQRANSVAE